MRTSLATLGAAIPGESIARRTLPAGRFRPATDPLSLPRFGKELTGSLDPCLDLRRWFMLALRWLDAGEIQGDESGMPQSLVQQAFARWINRHAGQLEHFAFGALVATGAEAISYGLQFSTEQDEETRWYWALQSEQVVWLSLKERITHIEATSPGLGETVLYWLQRSSGKTLFAYTPATARQVCEYIHWQGSSEQDDWVEEMTAMGMTAADMEEAISPDWFDGHFPNWVIDPKRVLDDSALGEIAAAGGELAPLASALLDVGRLDADGGELPGLEGMDVECVYFGAYLRWGADDPLERVFDDFIEYANSVSDGYTDLFGAQAVPLDQEGFAAWQRRTELGLQLLSALDRLIGFIAEPV